MFELGRVFRNEGISTRHNPEFTSVEIYQVRVPSHSPASLRPGSAAQPRRPPPAPLKPRGAATPRPPPPCPPGVRGPRGHD